MNPSEIELHKKMMARAIELSQKGMEAGDGGPFGAVVARGGEIIGEGWNRVLGSNDPTAHAEVVAIRAACEKLGSFQLEDCVIYTSCEPCPMCLGAIYWARPKMFFYGCTRADAAAIDFDDDFIYREIDMKPELRSIPAENLLRDKALKAFEVWKNMDKKIPY
ncbi:MAG: nucleoside deaminase [Saprospirales bacterium]|nr:MAG: nucleoside deaminase [Saprospirales bacterium]